MKPTRRFPRRLTALPGLVLAALVVLLFLPALNHEFVGYDDNLTITNNPMVLAGLSARGVAWAFTTFHAYNWQPLTWLSHMADVALFGPSPRGPHAVNVLLHAANTVLLLSLLRRLTGATWRSAFVALLFAVHPLHVESVAWISERKGLLSTLLWLLTLHAYARYAAAPSLKRGLPVLFAFAAGLLAKPMLVTVPFVLLLLDFWPLGRLARPGAPRRHGRTAAMSLVAEKGPLFVLACASAVVTALAQRSGGAVRSLAEYPVGTRVANALGSYAAYLGHMFWPSGLHAMYPYGGPGLMRAAVGGALLVAGAAAAWRQRSRRPWLTTGWYWYVGTLVPVIGLVQVGDQAMADRYTYVTLIGVFVILSWALAEAAAPRRRLKVALLALALPLAAALAAASRTQLGYWRDSLSLFGRSLQFGGNNHQARNNYGAALLDRGLTAEAAVQFREAVAGNPGYADAHHNLGKALWKLGRKTEALEAYRTAAALAPANPAVASSLGMALLSSGDFPAAEAVAASLSRTDPQGAQRLLQFIAIARKVRDRTGGNAE